MFNGGRYNSLRYNSRPATLVRPSEPVPVRIDLPWNNIGQYAPDLSDKFPYSIVDKVSVDLTQKMGSNNIDKVDPPKQAGMPFA